jgi:hypothetical protein
VPKCWLVSRGGYVTLIKGDEYINTFARWYAAGIASLANRGIQVSYVDLDNEPDCGPIISPAQYEAILKACRANLNSLGLTPDIVKIAGPGTAHIDFGPHGDRYVNALDSDAVSDLGAWANHAYIWNKALNESPNSFTAMPSAIPAEAASFLSKDPARKIPWIESEYGVKAKNFHGVTFNSDAKMRCSVPYAAREFADTLSLFDGGANALIYWEGADQSWNHAKWGLVDGNGQPKPVFDALSTLLPKLASRNYRVLTLPTSSTGLVTGAFADGSHLVVGLANPTGSRINASLNVTGGTVAKLSNASTYLHGSIGTAVLSRDPGGAYRASLPPDGVMSIEFHYR